MCWSKSTIDLQLGGLVFKHGLHIDEAWPSPIGSIMTGTAMLARRGEPAAAATMEGLLAVYTPTTLYPHTASEGLSARPWNLRNLHRCKTVTNRNKCQKSNTVNVLLGILMFEGLLRKPAHKARARVESRKSVRIFLVPAENCVFGLHGMRYKGTRPFTRGSPCGVRGICTRKPPADP